MASAVRIPKAGGDGPAHRHGGSGDGEQGYVLGHSESAVEVHRRRTAADSAAYLLPYLRAGMRVLDVGCGPGSITVDLAMAVRAHDDDDELGAAHEDTRGEVIGVDASQDVLEQARQLAASRRLPTHRVRFSRADAYRLPFADGEFDVVHCHQLLLHLRRPHVALREMRRVCRADGGIVAAREGDAERLFHYPHEDALDEVWRLFVALVKRDACGEFAGRALPKWARRAGFRLSPPPYPPREVRAESPSATTPPTTATTTTTTASHPDDGDDVGDDDDEDHVVRFSTSNSTFFGRDLDEFVESWARRMTAPDSTFLHNLTRAVPVPVLVPAAAPLDRPGGPDEGGGGGGAANEARERDGHVDAAAAHAERLATPEQLRELAERWRGWARRHAGEANAFFVNGEILCRRQRTSRATASAV